MRRMREDTPLGSSAIPRQEFPEAEQTNQGRRARLAALAPLAERQVRVVSRAQLTRLGWTPHQIAHEIDTGRWHLLAPNVIALQNAPVVGEQRLWLGVLHAGAGSALTHLTACRCAGLEWRAPDTVEVIGPKGHLVAPLEGFFFHQTRRPYQQWVAPTGSGLPVIHVEPAALLAAERDNHVRRAIGLIAAAVQQRLTTPERLLTASRGIRKLRHGRMFRLALGDIAGGAQSFAEIDIGRLCREAGLVEPTRQSVRTDRQGRRRYLDCEWLLRDGRVIVLEIDGSFHMRTEHWWRDMRRERQVVISGRTVLRCSSIELRLEPAGIVADLRAVGVPRSVIRLREVG
jgi:hypothetical protein